MTAKLFLDERNLRDNGLNPQNIATLRALTDFLNVQTTVVQNTTDITGLDTRLTAAETELLSPIDVKDEGGSVNAVKTLNFTGAGVAASVASLTGTVNVPGGVSDLLGEIGGDPNADRIVFWDDSAGGFRALAPGTNLTISGTTLNAAASGATIEKKTFDGTVGTYTFSSIPATYEHLELIFVGRSSATATVDQIQLAVNGLSTGIYDRQSHYANNTTPGSDQVLSGTIWQLGGMAAANAVANQAGFLQLTLHHYNQTTFNKTLEGFSAQANSTSTGTAYHIAFNGQCRTTNAITSLTLSLASGNFVSGSVALLVGK